MKEALGKYLSFSLNFSLNLELARFRKSPNFITVYFFFLVLGIIQNYLICKDVISGNVLLFKDSKIREDSFTNNALFRGHNNLLQSTCHQAQTNESGLLEMSCYSHAELNSRIELDLSKAVARRLKPFSSTG